MKTPNSKQQTAGSGAWISAAEFLSLGVCLVFDV
jgi:hypothetical protein